MHCTDVEYGAVLADAAVALVGVGDAAEAGADATGHHVLEAHLAAYAALGGAAGHGLHHGRGAAGVYHVIVLREGRVRGDDAVVAQGAVVGGEEQVAVGAEVVLHGDEACRAAAEEYGAVYVVGLKFLAQVQQGRCAGAAAHEEGSAAGGQGGGEAVAQGVDDIEALAHGELGQTARAVADNLDEEGQRAVADVVHRNGAAQHDVARALDEHLHKLARDDGLHGTVVLEHQTKVLVAQLLALYNAEFVYLFHVRAGYITSAKIQNKV